MLGYNRMLEAIKPQSILCYDESFPSMKGNIKSFLPTTYEWTKSLGWQDQAKFYMQKHTRNIIQKCDSSSLNKKVAKISFLFTLANGKESQKRFLFSLAAPDN